MRLQEELIRSLAVTPIILQELLNTIAEESITQRVDTSWTIQEWAAHLMVAQAMIMNRFLQFKEEKSPLIKMHEPNTNKPDERLMQFNLQEGIKSFKVERKNLLEFCRLQDAAYWKKEGGHEQYKFFNPYILLRHVLIIDHLHMFHLERLWLTKVEYLLKGNG